MTETDLETRIDRLESRNAIVEMCTRYGIACDFRDMETLRSLFTADAVIRSDNGSMNAQGIEQVMQMFHRMFKIRGPAFHWTHDRIVTFDVQERDRANGLVLAHAETTPDGTPSLAGLRYTDRYRRQNGRWHFEERILSFLYYVPTAQYLERLQQRERVWAGGTWHAADFPENHPAWKAYHEP